MSEEYDVVIVGGGLVGSCLAFALAQLPLRVGLIEKVANTTKLQADYDARSIVLSYGSRLILEKLALWSAVENFAMPIKQIHVSDKGYYGKVRFNAVEVGVVALGYVIEVPFLNQTIHAALSSCKKLSWLCPASVETLQRTSQGWNLTINDGGNTKALTTNLLVAADGGESMIRKSQQFVTEVTDYQQTAVIANVTLTKPHQNTAYERFTAAGPLAFLPLQDNRCAVVWTVANAQVANIIAMNDATFLIQLQKAFGYRLGRLQQVGKRSCFPLQMVQVQHAIQPGLVLVGNAAHTLHPIAAQGFNLGLRDVVALVATIKDSIEKNQDFSQLAVLEYYNSSRQADHKQTAFVTNSLVKLFSNELWPITSARNLGLLGLDRLSLLKRSFARRLMGLNTIA